MRSSSGTSPSLLGISPYWFGLGSEDITQKIKINKLPIQGTKYSNWSHPDFPVSCSLLHVHDRLTKNAWVFNWPSGRETYYNLDMSGVVKTMRKKGYSEKEYPYYVRKDWVKMLGDYVMVAANLKTRPRGTKLPTSLGEWIVCDTWGFVKKHPNWLDIATNW